MIVVQIAQRSPTSNEEAHSAVAQPFAHLRQRQRNPTHLAQLRHTHAGSMATNHSATPRRRRLEAARAAGRAADVEATQAVDPDLVERDSWLLGAALRQVVESLPDRTRVLVVGHSPTNEAAVLGLAGRVVPPLGKGEGVLLIEDDGRYRVESLD